MVQSVFMYYAIIVFSFVILPLIFIISLYLLFGLVYENIEISQISEISRGRRSDTESEEKDKNGNGNR